MECDVDHVYILFKAKPTLNIPKYINALKTITSREISKEFPRSEGEVMEKRFLVSVLLPGNEWSGNPGHPEKIRGIPSLSNRSYEAEGRRSSG